MGSTSSLRSEPVSTYLLGETVHHKTETWGAWSRNPATSTSHTAGAQRAGSSLKKVVLQNVFTFNMPTTRRSTIYAQMPGQFPGSRVFWRELQPEVLEVGVTQSRCIPQADASGWLETTTRAWFLSEKFQIYRKTTKATQPLHLTHPVSSILTLTLN